VHVHKLHIACTSPELAQGICGKKKLYFNRKKPLAEPDSGRAAIRLDQLGFLIGQERGGNKHPNTRPGTPAEKEKQVNDNSNVICTWRKKITERGEVHHGRSQQSRPIAA